MTERDYKFGLIGPEFAQEPVFAHHREALLKLLDETFVAFCSCMAGRLSLFTRLAS
jgi:hypothetical protein